MLKPSDFSNQFFFPLEVREKGILLYVESFILGDDILKLIAEVKLGVTTDGRGQAGNPYRVHGFVLHEVHTALNSQR